VAADLIASSSNRKGYSMADIPRNKAEIRHLLWRLLKERLHLRRTIKEPLGATVTALDPPLLFRESGERVLGQKRRADVELGSDGRTALGDMTGRLSSDLHGDDFDHVLPRVIDEVFELARVGILRPAPGSSDPRFVITPHGAACLAADDRDLPPFSQERVQQLRDRFAGGPDLDLLTRHYGEAIAAYHAGLDLSATVMIGVCYELGLHQVAQALVAYEGRAGGNVPGTNKDDRKVLKAIGTGKPVMASPLENLVHDVLVNGFGADLGDDLEWAKTCLRPNGHFVRNLRNAAGHPTGRAVDRDQIASYIMLFPDFFGRVRSIVGTVEGMS